jgi:hypothetical protein
MDAGPAPFTGRLTAALRDEAELIGARLFFAGIPAL